MDSLWNEEEAKAFSDNPKGMRIYTARLLGQNPNLVLHGGGNTSVKLKEDNFFGEEVDALFCKGSGHNLGTIEASGFTSLRLDALLKLAECDTVSDADLVKQQRIAMLDPSDPNPSVEALLHAIIPHKFVDHSHADAILALTNIVNGEETIRNVFGDRVLIVPYVMAGFALAKKVHTMIRNLDWETIDGIVLMSHGLFTFADDAQTSYENHIQLVIKADEYLETQGANQQASTSGENSPDLLKLAELRRAVSEVRGVPILAKWDSSPKQVGFSELDNIADLGTRGPVTPDHTLLTKRIPMVLEDNVEASVQKFVTADEDYFKTYKSEGLIPLDSAPRWAIWPSQGKVAFGETYEEANKISDIAVHTVKVIQQGEALGGWKPLPAEDIFHIEYWELQQAKLKNKPARQPLQGKVALVTGAASGIGKACAEKLHAAGAAVVATDLNPEIITLFTESNFIGQICDVTDLDALKNSVETAVSTFGGLDIVVSNAGIFPHGQYIDQMDDKPWDMSLAINLTQHKNLMRQTIPFLKLGIDATFIFIGTKNIPAPGPGAGAYSVAKAGLNQLMRVAALELGEYKIRVNIVHPDSVFDTAIWAGGVLEARAEKYGLNVEEYMSRNIMKTSVKSAEVAEMVMTMAGNSFIKTTGAQITVDGGNERII